MERDTSRDQSGDQAAWRDLVARLELPSAVDPASPPWPARESLRPASAPDEVGQPEPGTGNGPGRGTVNRSRVIRPATYLPFPDPGSDQHAPGQHAHGRHAHGQQVAGEPASGQNSADQTAADHAQPGQHQPGGPWTGSGRPGAGPGELPPSWKLQPRSGSGLEYPAGDDELSGLVRPELSYLDYYDQEADDGYVPPHIPPLPKLDPVARGAWTALFGGPGYLFIATTLGWQVPGWAELTAIVAFVTGFVVLVSRLGDGPSRRDGPDQGAVV